MTGAVVAVAVALTTRPQLSLVATPARVELQSAGRETVRVANRGSTAVVVDASRAGFALDLRGRPRIVAAAASRWLSVSPVRVAIQPGASTVLTVAARAPRGASPGDHAALLLLLTRPLAAGGIAVRMRLGVVVVVRVAGRIVHRLAIAGVRAHRAGRVLTLRLVNRGNVTELLGGRRVTVTLWRRGRLIARLLPGPRELLPRTNGLIEVRYRRLRGPAVARVSVGSHVRMFRVQL